MKELEKLGSFKPVAFVPQYIDSVQTLHKRKGMVIKMEQEKFFTYKGLPLVRKGNQIYYGNMSDETVATLQIMSTKNVNGLEVADRVKVWLMLTQTEGIDASEIMKKTCERTGLYEALDVAYIWLERDKQGA